MTTVRFYYQYSPLRRGLTGYEYIGQFIDENYPNCQWIEVINSDFIHYGILQSTNPDELAKAMQAIEGRFSAKRLTFEEFVGAVYLTYNPLQITMPDIPEDEQRVITIEQFLANYNIYVDNNNLLDYAKQYKKKLFKEVLRKKFNDTEDSVADLMKFVVLLNLHKDSLTQEQLQQVNLLTNALKQIYPVEVCIEGLQETVHMLATILGKYYIIRVALEQAQTLEEVKQITLVFDEDIIAS